MAGVMQDPDPDTGTTTQNSHLYPEEMMMDIEKGGGIKGPGYSDETFVDHPNPGMHYVAPPAPHPPSVFLPKKTPEQPKAQAESITARLASAKAVIEAAADPESFLVFSRVNVIRLLLLLHHDVPEVLVYDAFFSIKGGLF
ncbi:hypothetical protein Tco_1104652 [Tanacetum coccineum]